MELTWTIAVILAAGRGRRLRPLTDVMPKGLIEIGEKSILEYSLKKLALNGIKKAIIVVGYRATAIKEFFGSSFEGIEITYAENVDYATTGSMYSLLAAQESINEDIILLESDILFERKAIDVIVRSKNRNVILIAACRGTGDEVFIRVDSQGHLIDLGKDISDEEDALGELVGISKLSLSFLHQMYRQANLRRNGKTLAYEDFILLTVKSENASPVHCIFVKNLLWTDVDNENDLERAVEIISAKNRKRHPFGSI